MPTQALKTMAQKAGKSSADAERYWEEAKKQAKAEGIAEGSKSFYRYVMAIVKRRLGLEISGFATPKCFYEQSDGTWGTKFVPGGVALAKTDLPRWSIISEGDGGPTIAELEKQAKSLQDAIDDQDVPSLELDNMIRKLQRIKHAVQKIKNARSVATPTITAAPEEPEMALLIAELQELAAKAKPVPMGKYKRYIYKGARAVNFTWRGKKYRLPPNGRFGLRDGSRKGMFILVLEEFGPTVTLSVDTKGAENLLKRSRAAPIKKVKSVRNKKVKVKRQTNRGDDAKPNTQRKSRKIPLTIEPQKENARGWTRLVRWDGDVVGRLVWIRDKGNDGNLYFQLVDSSEVRDSGYSGNPTLAFDEFTGPYTNVGVFMRQFAKLRPSKENVKIIDPPAGAISVRGDKAPYNPGPSNQEVQKDQEKSLRSRMMAQRAAREAYERLNEARADFLADFAQRMADIRSEDKKDRTTLTFNYQGESRKPILEIKQFFNQHGFTSENKPKGFKKPSSSTQAIFYAVKVKDAEGAVATAQILIGKGAKERLSVAFVKPSIPVID